SKVNVPYLSEVDRGSILNLQDDILEILKTLDVPTASDKEFGGRYFEGFASDILITHPDRVDHIADRDVIGDELIRIEIHLVLLHEPADRRDFGHTFDRFQCVSDVPVLKGAQRGQIVFAAFVDECVLVDPADSGCIRSDDRIDSLR